MTETRGHGEKPHEPEGLGAVTRIAVRPVKQGTQLAGGEKHCSLTSSTPNSKESSPAASIACTMAVPSSLQDIKSRNLYVALVAEFLGTFYLVLLGCGSCLTYPGNIVGISIAFGLAVATMAWSIGHVSGCHINTAVTFAFLVTRKISIIRAVLYAVVQVLGAIVGAGVLKAVLPNPTADQISATAMVSSIREGLCTSSPIDGMSEGQVFGIELLITFVLIFTVFATCDGLRGDHGGSGPLSIGLSLTLVHLFAAPLTGAGMNPARVLGPAVISGSWDAHWAYWVGPLIGGALAGILYDFLFAVNATSAKVKGCFTRDYDDSQFGRSGALESADNQADVPLKEQA